jgi:hypothetical protein
MVTTAAALTLGYAFGACPLRIGCLDREIIPPFLVDFFQDYRDDIPYLDRVGDLVDTIRCDLGDVHEPVGAGSDLHECTEVHETYDFTVETLTYFILAGHVVDLLVCGFFIFLQKLAKWQKHWKHYNLAREDNRNERN